MRLKIVDHGKVDDCQWLIIDMVGKYTWRYGLCISCDDTHAEYEMIYYDTLEEAQEKAKTIKGHYEDRDISGT